MKETYLINGMACAHCAQSIETALTQQHGVNTVVISLEQATATIDYDTSILTFEQLQTIVEEIGYALTSQTN